MMKTCKTCKHWKFEDKDGGGYGFTTYEQMCRPIDPDTYADGHAV